MSDSPTETTVTGAENTDAGATGTTTPVENSGSPAAEKPKGAESPTAEGRQTSSVDAIQAAVAAAADGATPGSKVEAKGEAPKVDSVAPKGEGEDEEAKPITRADLKNLNNPKTQKRVGKLLDIMEATSAEVEKLKEPATLHNETMAYLKQHGIPLEDANAAIDIVRQIRHEPETALTRLRELVAQLEEVTGEALPEDLQKEVQGGYMTKARALELSKARAATARASKREEVNTAQAKADAEAKLVTDLENEISKWETEWAASDPDYQKKRQRVDERFELKYGRLVVTGKMPQTREEVRKLADEARKEIEAEMRSSLPARGEMRHVSGSSAAPVMPPKPTNSVDAILQGVNR